jgi:hypothetical protein
VNYLLSRSIVATSRRGAPANVAALINGLTKNARRALI